MKQARTIREMVHMLLLFRQAAMVVGLFAGPGLLRRALHRHTTVKKRLIGLPGKSGSRPAILFYFPIQKETSIFSFFLLLTPPVLRIPLQ